MSPFILYLFSFADSNSRKRAEIDMTLYHNKLQNCWKYSLAIIANLAEYYANITAD